VVAELRERDVRESERAMDEIGRRERERESDGETQQRVAVVARERSSALSLSLSRRQLVPLWN